ncbi:MAG: endonuclease/exonuclease/phosphatase family protein [Fimbriimonadaceae bacterium]|nr:endonuclease/exonuclease/phosphatase family protein [Fimbriimonadaceae bacterium]
MTSLTAATWNVRMDLADHGDLAWERRRGRILAALAEIRPDVIGLQEPFRRQIDDLLAGPMEFGMVGVGREDGRHAGEFSPILFDHARLTCLDAGTFWLSETPEEPGSRSWSPTFPRICTWADFEPIGGGSGFQIWNTHLDHESDEAREKGAALIAERVQGATGPAVVMGDLNCRPGSEPWRILADSGLRPAWQELHPGEPEPGTFTGYDPEAPNHMIDHVFVSAEWRIESAEVLDPRPGGGWPSDHRPLVCRLSLRGR